MDKYKVREYKNTMLTDNFELISELVAAASPECN